MMFEANERERQGRVEDSKSFIRTTQLDIVLQVIIRPLLITVAPDRGRLYRHFWSFACMCR